MEKMERPLLSGESSGNGRRNGPPAVFRRRSDAIAYGSPYQKAAALVDLAEDGIGLPEKILDKSNFQSSAKLYFLYIKLDFLWTLNYIALVVLNFLEKPLWCYKITTAAYSCGDRDYYFLGQLPYLNGWESLIYEGITLAILIIHNFFPISYEGWNIYRKQFLNQLKVLCLLILVADLLVYALYLSPVAFYYLPFRIAPYIRVVFLILSIRELRDTIVILAGMLVTYLNVMFLWLLFLLFASWVAYVVFEDTDQGKILFTSYGTTMYHMFVLFTTSNNPDVWIPAYKASRWYSLFFVLYVLLGVYFVTSLILAVVYDSFKGQLAKQVSEMDQMRTRTLEKAFNLIDKDKRGYINKDQCIQLFEELNKYRSLPKISREEFDLIFDELDDVRDFKINKDEFTDLCNAIALRFEKEDIPSIFEKFAPIYHSPSSEKFKAFVKSPKFGYIVSFILIVNLIAVIIETTLDIEENSAQKVWQEVEVVFGWIYVVEMALKVYSYGFANYWRDGQNRFDFVITWIIGNNFKSYWRNYNFRISSRTNFSFKRGVIFGGIVNVGNATLEATELADDDYLLFNFNDYPNGMVTLFNLLVMGNWHVWMQGYKDLTGTSWSLVYFISFYLITILLLLNLVVAFVLEAFFAEMDIASSGRSEDQETESGKGRRSVGTKTRSQRVDLLLHHMLSSELTQTQSSNA